MLMRRFFLPPLIAVILAGATPAGPQPFVVGEVMVKFVPGSQGDAGVVKVLRDSPGDLKPLESAIAVLQGRLRLPFTPVRLSGGNWVLLRLDAEQLAEQVVNRIRQWESISSIQPLPAKAAQAVAFRGLVIEFAPTSPEFRVVAKSNPGEPALVQLVNQLAFTAECPLKLVAVQEHRFLLVEIDLAALTMQAVEKLKTVEDIENAQPNFMVGLRPPP